LAARVIKTGHIKRPKPVGLIVALSLPHPFIHTGTVLRERLNDKKRRRPVGTSGVLPRLSRARRLLRDPPPRRVQITGGSGRPTAPQARGA